MCMIVNYRVKRVFSNLNFVDFQQKKLLVTELCTGIFRIFEDRVYVLFFSKTMFLRDVLRVSQNIVPECDKIRSKNCLLVLDYIVKRFS